MNKQVCFTLSEELFNKFKALAKSNNISFNAMLRLIISNYLKNQEK